jgi:diadenosine tetraphosphate (Ap4A) HIT family hydrolase
VRVVDKDEALALLQTHHAKHPMGACVPCELVRGAQKTPQYVAHNAHGVVVVNRFAGREGHLLVISRKHVEHVHELSWTEYSALQRLAYDASSTLTRALAPKRVYTAVLGSPAPLLISYPHLHIHLLPVHETDERARPARVFSWSEGVVVYEDHEVSELAARLREQWPTDG